MKYTPQSIDNLLDRLIYTLMEYEQIAKPPNKGRVGKDLRLLREARPFLATAPDLLQALGKIANKPLGNVLDAPINWHILSAVVDIAKAAIAKAKP